ncbi:MFS transporter [Nocardioides marmoribigeumensis]|uniref:EmrB/QacA subfamily drug resistance transporter n=1 Tax=Nocardioides marmoribigeumensis TaxID=433649 RepID=A0ABU2BYF4_9ACTN|nr:MFS transporter [Nocardioides marmoribigeumensis]MDR7363433.1 EmrB/QacA subfamily drug resistance transporter [Nocardioides marmoribigeumensis]
MVTFASPQGRWLLLASILGSGLAGIDATVVNVALPAIGRSFDTSFTTLQWTVTAYAFTLAAFILLGGGLGDRFGRRRVFVVGVVWFALASLLCGLAPSAGVLVAARALQGLGAALLTPGSLAMLQASFVPEDRARAIGTWSGLGGVATAVGPFLGGWLVDVASWRWVFLINLPLAAVVVAVAVRHVPETRDPRAAPSLDPWGAVLGAVALGGLSFGLIEAGSGGALALPAGVLGLVAGVAFVLVERRSAHPMLPPEVFRSAQFTAANAVTFVAYAAIGVAFFLLVIDLQVVAGYGPIAAGTSLLPITLVMLALSSRSGELAARIGPRRQMAVGPLVCALGFLLLLRVDRDTSYLLDVVPAVLVIGLGLATMVAPLTATALASAPDEHAGLASGVNNAVARTGGLVAVAGIPALAGLDGRVYDDPVAFADGFAVALWVSAGLMVVAGVLAALGIRDTVLETAPAEEPAPKEHLRQLSHCGLGAPPLATCCDDEGHTDCEQHALAHGTG